MDENYQPGMGEEHGSDQLNADGSGAPHGENRFWDDMDPSNPIGYIRDPHRLITYLIPFPKPTLTKGDTSEMPERFLIYTPPPPPLFKPSEGKEGKVHLVQRKWQTEVREAKTSDAKTLSWKGIKSKAVRGISWAVDKTTTSNLDYLGRVADNEKKGKKEKHEAHEEKHEELEPKYDEDEQKHEHEDEHAEDGVVEGDTTKKTVGVEELVLVYPPTTGLTPDQIKEEFVNSMLRTKSKAQKEAIIATALLPISFGIDLLATPIWPFGGLGEVDAVWAYSTIRGAKAARSVTKRLSSSDSEDKKGTIRMNFVESDNLQVMQDYLLAECQRLDAKLFPGPVSEEGAPMGNEVGAPTEEDVLKAIAWSPSERDKNWEDEQWEVNEVKMDLKHVMKKGGKEWIKWCKAYQKNPKKAAKK